MICLAVGSIVDSLGKRLRNLISTNNLGSGSFQRLGATSCPASLAFNLPGSVNFTRASGWDTLDTVLGFSEPLV